LHKAFKWKNTVALKSISIVFRLSYATSRKMAGSISDEVTGFSIDLTQYGPGVDSVSKRNEYQEFSWG
jgi:hypothetical protein